MRCVFVSRCKWLWKNLHSHLLAPKEKPSLSEIAKAKFNAFIYFIANHTSEEPPSITKTVISLLIPILYSEKDIRKYSAPIIASLIKR